MPQEYLKWHYRSRHESLIAYSNMKYYDNKLLTFPSNNDLSSKVSSVHPEGFYDKGKTKQNKAEARAVVDEIIRRYQGHKVRLAVVHGAAYDDAVKLRDRLMERLDVVSSFISPVSPALAIHTGPGLLGAIVQLAE